VEIATMATQRKPTFSPEELNTILNDALAKQRAEFEATMAAMSAKGIKPKANTNKTDAAVLAAFKRAGYTDLVLFDRTKTLAEQGSTVTILTFNKWMDLGRRPIEGEHALRVRGTSFRLFHKSQTRVATVEERKANFQTIKAAAEKREKADQPAA
jgi:hypothetical protein